VASKLRVAKEWNEKEEVAVMVGALIDKPASWQLFDQTDPVCPHAFANVSIGRFDTMSHLNVPLAPSFPRIQRSTDTWLIKAAERSRGSTAERQRGGTLNQRDIQLFRVE
jgi:hypothetical protein